MAAEGAVEVVPGQPVVLVLDFQLGVIVLEAAMADEGPPLEDDRALDWRIGSGDAARVVNSQSRPRLTLKAGRYPVTLSIAGVEVTAEAAVAAGEERVKRVVVKGGELGLAARLGPEAELIDDWRDATWTVSAVSAVGVAPGASEEALGLCSRIGGRVHGGTRLEPQTHPGQDMGLEQPVFRVVRADRNDVRSQMMTSEAWLTHVDDWRREQSSRCARRHAPANISACLLSETLKIGSLVGDVVASPRAYD